MQHKDLIACVWQRIRADRDGIQRPDAPVTDEAWRATEAAIGFPLPPLLHRLFREVGNGGFGPGYGLRGAIGGAQDDNGSDLVNFYHSRFDQPLERAEWIWPKGIVGLNDWGCAIVSCVDCRDLSYQMIGFDPNGLDAEVKDSWKNSFVPEGLAFDEWIGAWATGKPLKQPQGRSG